MQECGVGLVRIRRDAASGRLAFAAPPLRKSGPLPDAEVELIARGLGIARGDIAAHAWCDNGPNWRGVLLRSSEQVLALQPDAGVLAGLDVGVVGPRGKVGVAGPRGAGDDCAFEVRAFFPGNNGLAEDPVTGSLNAALAQWLIGAGLAPERYIASQGTALGRAGRVHVERDGRRRDLDRRPFGHLHRRRGAAVSGGGARVDHLVVVADSLEQGAAWCERTLGVAPGPGGEHALMGTHNRLLRIATVDFPQAYFEIIARNPAAPAPERSRWFDMDQAGQQAAVREHGPRLAHWVARVPDLDAALAAWRELGLERGDAVEASRETARGLLRWRISLRPDGQRLLDGCLPTLIEWGGPHPAAALPESAVTLHALALQHPQAGLLGRALAAIGMDRVAVLEGPANLGATLRTPKGTVRLESSGL